MILLTASVLTAIFLFLSAIHVYWGFGGKWAVHAVLPTINEKQKVIAPGALPSFIVAFGLLFFGLLVMVRSEMIALPLPDFLTQYGLWAISGISALRAIGEFKYLGFFKKHRNSKFARNDTRFYSPLCLLIALLAVLLELAV